MTKLTGRMSMPHFFLGCLLAGAIAATARPAAAGPPKTLRDKTLVAWVRVGDLAQRGGSVLTLDDQQGRFDGIVFGELSPRKWMAGSNFFHRTQRPQADYPTETANLRDENRLPVDPRSCSPYASGSPSYRVQLTS